MEEEVLNIDEDEEFHLVDEAGNDLASESGEIPQACVGDALPHEEYVPQPIVSRSLFFFVD